MSCNSSIPGGKVLKSGDCLGMFAVANSFSQNIQRVSGAGQTVVEYQAGKSFYFFSECVHSYTHTHARSVSIATHTHTHTYTLNYQREGEGEGERERERGKGNEKRGCTASENGERGGKGGGRGRERDTEKGLYYIQIM